MKLDSAVNLKRCLLAAASILVLPHTVHAQQATQTYAYPSPPARGVSTGFSITMNPGPGNTYTYPIVWSVTPGSAAEAAGLMVGDTIISVDGRDMREDTFFPTKVAGTRYVMLVRRGDEEIELAYTYPQVENPRPEGAATPPL